MLWGSKIIKKIQKTLKRNSYLDNWLAQFIYLMNKVKTLQWETQTSNLWKEDCINITSNNSYTLFLWHWYLKIKNLLTPIFCSLLLSLIFSHALSFCHPPLSYGPFPSFIPLVGSFWDIFPPSICYPSPSLLSCNRAFRGCSYCSGCPIHI